LSATDQPSDLSQRRTSLAIVQIRIDGIRDENGTVAEELNLEDAEEEKDEDEDDKPTRRILSNGHTTPRNQEAVFGTRQVLIQDPGPAPSVRMTICHLGVVEG
jgi:hypothetical protein